ncbi:hypothetical protein GWI33_014922 [Rhynchophorus ferrugineus]|uniref:Uncharacterized protein n=1 Tax=Rhynchophorus ferrugineus TaxID=354439 RepID=A0A834M8L7_RHYFE|nr:hypothetical protein GWI33_014922 [Rhynchophorus ferrugineus]
MTKIMPTFPGPIDPDRERAPFFVYLPFHSPPVLPHWRNNEIGDWLDLRGVELLFACFRDAFCRVGCDVGGEGRAGPSPPHPRTTLSTGAR